tara:strand:- start:705 stop:1244 length:540 start_codon:yes stop_codon:yes gene_type:complete
MKVSQVVPNAQIEIVKKALDVYKNTLKKVETDDTVIQYEIFDTTVLKGLFNSKVTIELTENEYNNFTSKNGVDFPQYSKGFEPILIEEKYCYTEVLRDEYNDRIIYIERDKYNTIIGLNCMQGADDIEHFEPFKENDHLMLEFYNEFKYDKEYKNIAEIEKVNKIIWLFFKARSVFDKF